ncbi:hypothetical protein F5Y10DRAFT_115729 [Nemania abortiva]|nr:hypothetical protein F5Y10DRAFT_115729 [Nemania abortiva]
MADSPLSITASITGILTFIAAITTFFYVRYQMITNSFEEMRTIVSSVENSIEDTLGMAQTTFPGDHVTTAQFKLLILNIIDAEIDILGLVPMVSNQRLQAAWQQHRQQYLGQHGQENGRRNGRQNEQHNQQHNQQLGPLQRLILVAQHLLDIWERAAPGMDRWGHAALHLLIRPLVGSPVLWKWYRTRGEVIELMQQREALKSRQYSYILRALNMKQDRTVESLNHLTREMRAISETLEELRLRVETPA